MQDYSLLFDDDVQRYIAKSEQALPALPENVSLTEWRDGYLALCQHFEAPIPAGLTIEDRQIEQISCRVYTPSNAHPKAVIVFFHGGGFVLGNLDSHHSICADISHQSNIELIAVNYRLAPEHRHPAQIEDCLAVTTHICANMADRNILLMGDSAGAWLAAMLSDRLRAKISGQILIYPTLSGDLSWPSYRNHAHAPGLTTADIKQYSALLFGEDANEQDMDGPLRKTDFSQLPETIIFSAMCDPLHDDGPAYAAKLNAAGSTAICYSQDGLIHGYLRGRYHADKIAQAFDDIICAVKQLAS